MQMITFHFGSILKEKKYEFWCIHCFVKILQFLIGRFQLIINVKQKCKN